MAGRKRHSAEEIVRKLRRADELAAAGRSGEEIAAELEVSAATLYNWRRQYGGIDTDAARELEELREQNARLKRLLADAELEKDALREISKDAPIDVKPPGPVGGGRRAGFGRPRGRGIA
ncbi:transposase [Nocardia wallacei]|uniref:transposase n=1 Tax=Nocardia wallacei TaxID=480035 RepID=UPI00245546C8|nr:transposase [Nocardia wallacei]